MKQLIILVILAMTSCHDHEPVIIGKEHERKDGVCAYSYMGLERCNGCFEDSCSKYSIGDTIR